MEKMENHLWKTFGKIGKPMEIRMELEWKINGTSTIFVDFRKGLVFHTFVHPRP